jgi:hypothetical protein
MQAAMSKVVFREVVAIVSDTILAMLDTFAFLVQSELWGF